MKVLGLVVLLFCWCLTSCLGGNEKPITRQLLVGSYSYKSVDTSVDRASDHEADALKLDPDGTFELKQGGATKRLTIVKGLWSVLPGDPPDVLLNHAGYPIEVRRTEVRLLINGDLGEWYVKRR